MTSISLLLFGHLRTHVLHHRSSGDAKKKGGPSGGGVNHRPLPVPGQQVTFSLFLFVLGLMLGGVEVSLPSAFGILLSVAGLKHKRFYFFIFFKAYIPLLLDIHEKKTPVFVMIHFVYLAGHLCVENTITFILEVVGGVNESCCCISELLQI